MQNFKTITRTTREDVYSVHYEEVHKVRENAQKQVAELCLDFDATGSNYYVNATRILANLTESYYSHCDDEEYYSVDDIMQCFNCLTYHDEKDLYDDCVQGTAFEKLDFYDYLSLYN